MESTILIEAPVILDFWLDDALSASNHSMMNEDKIDYTPSVVPRSNA